jgi:hypothetical protein
MLKYIAVFAIGCAAPALAQSTVVQSLAFDTCVQSLQAPVAGALQPPVLTVDTDQVKEQLVQVPSGQVTVTCSNSEQTVTLKYQQ